MNIREVPWSISMYPGHVFTAAQNLQFKFVPYSRTVKYVRHGSFAYQCTIDNCRLCPVCQNDKTQINKAIHYYFLKFTVNAIFYSEIDFRMFMTNFCGTTNSHFPDCSYCSVQRLTIPCISVVSLETTSSARSHRRPYAEEGAERDFPYLSIYPCSPAIALQSRTYIKCE